MSESSPLMRTFPISLLRMTFHVLRSPKHSITLLVTSLAMATCWVRQGKPLTYGLCWETLPEIPEIQREDAKMRRREDSGHGTGISHLSLFGFLLGILSGICVYLCSSVV